MTSMWTVVNHEEFEPEFDALTVEVQDRLIAHVQLLRRYGPSLGGQTRTR